MTETTDAIGTERSEKEDLRNSFTGSALPIVNFGIAGFGYAFGVDQDVSDSAATFVTDPERVIRWGYQTFHRAEPQVSATMLAADAARDVLKQLDMAPTELDLVVLATSEMPDYLHWDTSAGLARELGIERTQTLLLNEGCASGVTGLGMVAGHLVVQPELRNVLFVAVNRVSEYHRNRMNVNNAVHSDGAVAVVLRRGHDRFRWLSTDQFTYPDLCDFFRTDYGGAITPVAPADWSTATAPSGLERVLAHFDKDPNRLRVFQEQLSNRVTEVIQRACERAGVDQSRLTHVIYINDSADTIEEAAAPFGISIEHTNAEISAQHGHMGAADQLISLGELQQRGDLKPGDVVALSGISIGMRWYCTLIEV
ncbi:MAG TPA: 3-oxoacyl-[acyl-carrier-protein] synthase III C-terminal domain-containing protein [Jatrophihabitans sp.]|nr:3-oxoacyl-[acyl-carrier-protein] synthase III C-terminal domain-containing protein [Jatrophihabitans sp.]